MSGIKLAILYGLVPHKLGFCGPKKNKADALLKFLKNKNNVSEKEVRKILKKFKGAYGYYKLIAKSNRVNDPFDEKVVKAYWVGNELLEKVKFSDLQEMIIRELSRSRLLPKEIVKRKVKEIPKNSKPHHSFHVFVVGSITGRIILKGKLLDLCRVGWGKVKKVQSSKFKVQSQLVVIYKPLVGKKRLNLGKEIEKEVNWDKDLVPEVKIGDYVSFHWNQVVEVLNNKDVKNLEKYTKITLESLFNKK